MTYLSPMSDSSFRSEYSTTIIIWVQARRGTLTVTSRISKLKEDMTKKNMFDFWVPKGPKGREYSNNHSSATELHR